MISRVGRWCFVHRRATVLIWLFALVGFGALGNGVVGSSYSSQFDIPASESATGARILTQYFPSQGLGGRSGTIVFESTDGVNNPQVSGAMMSLFERVEGLEGVAVISPYSPMGAQQISQSKKIAFATVNLDRSLGQSGMAEVGSAIRRLADRAADGVTGLTVEVGGQELAGFKPPESELIGLGFAIIVLILAFGSVLAMGLPIGIALFGVGIGASVVAMLSHLVSIPDSATTLGAMIGLAVGIDYSLFIVTRFRELTRAGHSYPDAVQRAMDTAGRAVLFAGITVVVSLLGMLLVGLAFVSGMGMGAATTVAVTMTASITLLPALLGFARHRVEVTRWRGIIAAGFVALALFGVGLGVDFLLVGVPLAAVTLIAGFAVAPLRRELKPRVEKPARETYPYRWSRLIQAHPWTSALSGTLVLLLLAAPVLSLRLGFSDEGNFDPESTTRRAYDMLAEGFGPGFNGPLLVAVSLPSADDARALAKLSAAVSADPGVAYASPAIPNTGTNTVGTSASSKARAAVMRVIPTTSPQDAQTSDTVRRLRETVLPAAVAGTGAQVYVTGSTATSIDFTSYLAKRLVVFIGVVLLVSFVLLMMVFRSLLVPLKAVVMNVLSIAAAYGTVVAIFQWGWASGLFGVNPAPIEPFVPMMMFAIVFGLSMDYEVFLLSRIREEYSRTGDAKESVADGLAATARVITAAAAIMIVVFGAFLLEEDRIIKLFGTGLAVAVLLDATLVRLLLVPATMELLGARNWWLPAWLQRILPRLNVEGSHDDPGTAAAPTGGGAPDDKPDDELVPV